MSPERETAAALSMLAKLNANLKAMEARLAKLETNSQIIEAMAERYRDILEFLCIANIDDDRVADIRAVLRRLASGGINAALPARN
jgi:hypothetical protein